MTDHLMSRHSPPAWLSIRSQLPQPLDEFFPDTNIQESFHPEPGLYTALPIRTITPSPD